MAGAPPPEPPPNPTIRVSVDAEGVEIESSHARDTVTKLVRLARQLYFETRVARPGLGGGMGFTTTIRTDDLFEQDPDDGDV